MLTSQNSLKVIIDKEGGDLTREMHEDVTHYITNKVGSRNYFVCDFSRSYPQAAIDQCAAIVPSQWVHDSVDFGISSNLQAYKYALFQGLVVTTTGFDLRTSFVSSS